MSKVRINNDELESISTYIRDAETLMNEIENEWATSFSNLCNNFGVNASGGVISEGFLDSLYKDAESQYYRFANLGYVVSYTAGGFGSGALIGSVAGTVVPGLGNIAVGTIGGIIGAVIGFFRGIYHCVKNPTSIKWSYESRDVFANLLSRCGTGDEDNYTAIENEIVKLANMQLAITKIKTKINEFNELYANLKATAEDLGVNTVLANDGVTVLGIETSVSINGTEVTTTTSEALNAFFTYSNTVTSGEIVADYLARTYGYEVNYTDIVKNANTFMTNTINSGLYTHEFVEGVLPEYDPTREEAYKAVNAATGVDLDKIESALNNNASIAGSVALFGGLLGSAFVGALGSNSTSNAIVDAVNGTPSGGTPSGGGGTPGGTPGGKPGGNGNDNDSNVTVTPVDEDGNPIDPDKKPGDDKNPEEDPNKTPEDDPNKNPEDDPNKEPEGPINDIPIEEIPEHAEIPEKVDLELYEDGKTDYDELARNEFEFGTEYEEIIEHRIELTNEVEEGFASGNLEAISAKLKEYGYSTPEIAALLENKELAIRAILEGDQNAQIAAKATEMAKTAGVEDFSSSYSERPNYDDLLTEGPSETLLLATEDKGTLDAKATMDEAVTNYKKAVEETNTSLAKVANDKKAMNEIKEKYETEFGTDTKKWTEEAVNEYNESIKTYKESLAAADEKLTSLEQVKTDYTEAKTKFNNARSEYIDKQKKAYFESKKTEDIPIPEEPPVEEETPREPAIKVTEDGISI